LELDIQSQYARVMALFWRIVDSKRDQQLPVEDKWLYDTETLAVKLFNHLASIRYLSCGTVLPQFGDRAFSFFDHSSINVLARAAFETYLTFYFLFCDVSSSIEERRFRHLLWRLSGPMDRKDFTFGSHAAREVLTTDKQIAAQLLIELENNPLFLGLKEHLRKLARKGEWRLDKKWIDLAVIAGLDRDVFRMVYKYLCSYAHAGGWSGLQIQQAINPEDQQKLIPISIQYGLLLMSNFLFTYTSLFPDTKSLFESAPEYLLADRWHISWKEDAFKSH